MTTKSERKPTGRRFKCIALEEKQVNSWKSEFKIGEVYEEGTGGYYYGSAGILAMFSHDKLPSGEGKYLWYVDAACFELVEGE